MKQLFTIFLILALILASGCGFKRDASLDELMEIAETTAGSSITAKSKRIYITDPSTGNQASVNGDGQLHVVLMGMVDENNSSNTPLNAGITFTGDATDLLDFGFIFITIFSDQDSAADGLSFQQSSDGTNWDNTDDFNYIANSGKTYSVQPAAKWFRVVYTNGSSNQGVFRLQTILKKTSSLPSSHRICDNLSPEDDGTLSIAIIKGQKPGGDYTDFSATAGGNFKMSLEELESGISSNSNKQLNVTQFDSTGREIIVGRTAFDELHVAELTPVVQLQFPYNINTEQVSAHENDSGTVTQADNMAVLQSGTGASARAEIQSLVPIKYNPGQGGLVRLSSIFTSGVADSSQFVGIGDISDGYFFGYSGSSFGVLKRRGGAPEIRILIITAASQTAENITIELDGDSDATVAVTNQGADTASTRTLTANEIADHDFSDVGTGWGAVAEGASVVFVSFDSATHSGAYSITATTAAGNYVQLVAGSAPAEAFIAQSSWNGDVMDGTGSSGITLDPTKGNVYQISYQWLGFGQICFFIENPATGDFVLIHRIEYANANIIPSVDNPTLPLSAMVVNTGNTSNLTVKLGSMGGFIEGKEPDLGLLKSASIATVAVAATEIPLISIKNKFDYQGKRNRVRVRINVLGISNDSKDIIILAHLNPTLTAASFSDISTNTSVMAVDTSATALSGGAEIFSVSLNKDESDNIPLKEYDFKLNPGDILTFAGISIAAGTTVSVSVNWKELF